MVIVVDDADRENEGDLIMAAQYVTPAAVNFMAQARARLDLRADDPANGCSNSASTAMVHRTAKVSAPIFRSAWTPRAASPPASAPPTARGRFKSWPTRHAVPEDLVQPGHVFPLRARPGGVLQRAGHTEAGVDLARARRLPAHRRAVRNHERRRHDGAAAATVEIRQEAQTENLHRSRI